MPYSSQTKYLLKHAGIDIHTRAPTSPISLKILCSHFGLKYKKVQLDHNTCGMMIRSVKGIYIAINADHSYARRRFSVAHEFGHWYFGHDSDVSKDNDQNRYEEVQANKFASSLLMPDELLFYVHKEQSSIREMANWLRVSPISVAIRCIQFGFRQMEAELVKSDYYQFLNEAATTSSIKSTPKPHKSTETVNIYDLRKKESERISDRLIEELRKTSLKPNTEMLDKLRHYYGYE